MNARSPKPGSDPAYLMAYFHQVFLPTVSSSSHERSFYNACGAIGLLGDFLQSPPKVNSITPQQLDDFLHWGERRGRSRCVMRRFRWVLSRILRLARPDDFPRGTGRWKRRIPPGAEPVDAPGSLWNFFRNVYGIERRQHITPDSMDQMRHAILRLLRFTAGGLRLTDLNEELLCRWATHMEASGLSRLTCFAYISRIRTLWRHASRKKLLPDVPLSERRPKRRALPESWTLEEFASLLRATRSAEFDHDCRNGIRSGLYFRALLLTAYDTGLRSGDLFALQWRDLRDDGVLTIVQGKTGVPITRAVRRETLTALRAITAPQRALIFPTVGDPTMFYRMYRSLLALAGLPVHRRNQLQKVRRTCATYAELQQPGAGTHILGHRCPDMAKRHYIDPRIAARVPLLPPAPPELEESESRS